MSGAAERTGVRGRRPSGRPAVRGTARWDCEWLEWPAARAVRTLWNRTPDRRAAGGAGALALAHWSHWLNFRQSTIGGEPLAGRPKVAPTLAVIGV